ncbi:MAG: leucine-rich repeat domain-containing protein [Muribaculaceae bacterium]|nr:leucine-rich repeat domain-containing protein [Muribaculaceae bacterium]
MSIDRMYSHIVTIIFIASLCYLVSCSGPAEPDNFEPIIELLPATDITRTEAVISVRVLTRGSNLTYLSFHYGETENTGKTIPVDDPETEFQTLRLEGLRPGATYYYFVEGGTTTASLRSQTMSFTTFPNGLPKVSALMPLSTGPVGIIVSFDITDDGGEQLLDGGCEVKNAATLETTRIKLSAEDLTVGTHRFHIGGLSLLTRYIITPFAANSAGETQGEPLDYTTRNSVVLDEAGSLAELLDYGKDLKLEHLSVAGNMNGDDFRFIRRLLGAPAQSGEAAIDSRVTSVDFSDVNIVEGGGSYDGSRFTVADELTTGIFADCNRLRHIQLPMTAIKLARDAFANCSSLVRLIVPAAVRELLPSEGCTALDAIEVSDANPNYTSLDGVLFNSEATEILWFPIAKTGAYSLPGTITSIGENAFYGTNISSLDIPSSVTSISRGAFAGSSLTEISLPDNITNVSEGMFQNCSALSTVRLGYNTEYIGNYVFDGTSICNLYISAQLPPFAAESAFVNGTASITADCILYVPRGCKAVYRNHSKWGRFGKIEEF